MTDEQAAIQAVMQAALAAADAQMRAAGRLTWNAEDYYLACETLAKALNSGNSNQQQS